MRVVSPYKYLDSYEIHDEPLFFGRDEETEILLADVVVGRLVLLSAKTGIGKTSLINAGVRPALHRRGYSTFYVRVGWDPAASALTAIELSTGQRINERTSFADQVERVARELRQPVVLFFDQFEEFFLYLTRTDSEVARRFITDVASIYENDASGVHVVLSIREESFAEMEMFRGEIPTILHEESSLRLRWFERGQAEMAITGPATMVGVEVEPALVERLLDDLAESGLGAAEPPSTGRIEPVQLQIVCDTLWRMRRDDRITLDDYHALSTSAHGRDGVQQILNTRLQADLDRIDSMQQLELLERLLPELSTVRQTKRVWEFQRLLERLDATEHDLRDLVYLLEQVKLLMMIPGDDAEFVELTNDSLVQRLPDLARGVRATLAHRTVLDAVAAARENPKGLLDSDDLAAVLERVEDLELTPDQGDLLLRSVIEHRVDPRPVLAPVIRSGAPLWAIAREFVEEGDTRQASAMVVALAKLQTPEAFELLEWNLAHRPEKAVPAMTLLASVERPEAIRFFAKALEVPMLRSQARKTLQSMSLWMRPDLAAAAESLLARSSTPPPAAS
jgi:hypothetical protein